MSLESPVASEPDSLGEKEPMGRHLDSNVFVRGHVNSTTFTRQRPTNLHRNQTRTHRQSLLSPHSVDNLDTDDADTPDFAMTQSMYEPYGKKEQIEKLSQQNKLMNLIASEKAAYAAQKRKQKEMKQKAIEQKKKNEERQKIVEERRIRMLAEEEEKRKKLLNKTTTRNNNNITTSYYGNMTQSIIVKQTPRASSKLFATTRPMSSTGKIFGFGSSAPRYTCDPIKPVRSAHNNPSLLDMSRESLPLSRMCTSQIVTRSTSHDNRDRSGKNISSNISKSTANVSDINRMRNKTGRGSTPSGTGSTIRLKIPRTTPKNIKNFNAAVKLDSGNKKPSDIHNRSRPLLKEVTTPTKLRSITVDRQIQSPSKPLLPKNIMQSNSPHQKSMGQSDENRIHSKDERLITAGIRSKNPVSKSTDEREPVVERKSEVRFINPAIVSNRIEKENNDNVTANRNNNSKELTKEEYKEKINMKRKLAKEKKKKEEIEKEIEKERELSEHVNEPLTPVDTTESEISINILPRDKESEHPIIPQSMNETMKFDNETEINTPWNEKNNVDMQIVEPVMQAAQEKENKLNVEDEKPMNDIKIIPSIEISKGKENLTASTDELDRLERKKRLESIMSRIKKTPSGSSENISHHMSTSTLQTMMDKGHLSGMSKAAAVLMRNANRSSELFASNSDLHSVTDNKTPSISTENLSNSDKIQVDDVPMSRGDCDGKADSPKDINPDIATKSNIMQNLSANAEGSYFTSWKEKYSVSDSLDSENDNTEGI